MSEIELKKDKACMLCGTAILFDGSQINIVSITEQGNVITPYNSGDSDVSAIVPLCCYHIVLSQYGIIALTTQNRIITSRRLLEFEALTDAKLKFRAKITRTPKLKEESIMAKAIIEARKMQSEMTEETTK